MPSYYGRIINRRPVEHPRCLTQAFLPPRETSAKSAAAAKEDRPDGVGEGQELTDGWTDGGCGREGWREGRRGGWRTQLLQMSAARGEICARLINGITSTASIRWP